MHEYAQICLNDFCFIFPHCNQLTYCNVYTKLEVLVLRNNDAVFLEIQNVNFSIVAVILFGFCFGLNIFTRFQARCYLWRTRGWEL